MVHNDDNIETKSPDDTKASKSVNSQVMLPPTRNVTTSEKEFPLTLSKSRKKSKAKRRRSIIIRRTNGLFSWVLHLLLDGFEDDRIKKNLIRTFGSKRQLCFTYDEVVVYERNCYYRSAIIGSITGGMVYLVISLFLVLPETHEEFRVFRDSETALNYALVLLAAIIFTYLLRIIVLSYVNILIIIFVQISILVLAIFGSFEFDCDTKLDQPPLSGGGHFPIIVIGIVEKILGYKNNLFRRQLYDMHCAQTVIRLNALNVAGELISFVMSIVLIINSSRYS